jgi:hypothetical protein
VGSVFESVRPCRLLDSRLDGGQPVTGTIQVDTAECLRDVSKGEVVAVSITATVVAPQRHGHLTLWSSGAKPTVSSLNWAPGEVRANSAVVTLRAGKFLASPHVPTHLVLDVNAVFVRDTGESGGRFVPLPPERVLDSRLSNGRQQHRVVKFDMIPQGATGVVVTLTTTETTGPGHFTAWSEGPRRETSVLNVDGRNQTRAATIMIGVSADRELNIRSFRPEHAVVDIVGYYGRSDHGMFIPTPPKRLLDTRIGGVPVWRGGTVTGDDLDAAGGTLVANVTSVNPRSHGWMHIGAAQQVETPTVSSLNFAPGSTVANAAVVPLSSAGWALHSLVTSDAVVDVFGYFTGPRTLPDKSIVHRNNNVWKSASCVSSQSRPNENGHAEANPGRYQRVVSIPETGRLGAVAVVGDSLTYQSARDLAAKLQRDGWGPVCVDGTISRTVEYGNSSIPDGLDAVRRIRSVSSEWTRSDVTWVVALGTNDSGFSRSSSTRANTSAAKLANEIGNVGNIFWVNTRTNRTGSPASYEAAWNAGVSQLGVRIINWSSAAQTNPAVMGGDKVHLTSLGVTVRNDVIVRALR